MAELEPVAANLWTEGPQPCLIAGRRKSDGAVVFPLPTGGSAEQYEKVLLPRRGTLWSWTIQSFPPKSPPYSGPAEFVPFAVGYVQLGDVLIVEARLTCVSGLKIGMDMALEIVRFDARRTTYAFAPTGAA